MTSVNRVLFSWLVAFALSSTALAIPPGKDCPGFWKRLYTTTRDIVTSVATGQPIPRPPRPAPEARPPRGTIDPITIPEILGTLMRHIRNPFQVFNHFLNDEPIRIFRFPGFNDVVFVGNYDIARQLLLGKGMTIERDGMATAAGSAAYGDKTPFVGGKPDIHAQARKHAQSAFTPKAVYTPELTGNMTAAAGRLTDVINAHVAQNGDKPLVIDAEMKSAALYAMLKGVFGYDTTPQEVRDHIWPTFHDVNGMVLLESMLSTSGIRPSQLPTVMPAQARIKKSLAEVDVITDRILANARRPDAKKDFLFYDLVRDPKIPEDYIRSIIKTSVAGAMETSASYVSWAVESIARHPDAAKELREEVMSVCGTGPITPDHIKQMPKLAAFIKESGRMYTPFYVTPRRLESDATVQTPTGPVTLRQGSQVWVSLYNANHDPLSWEIPGAAPADQFDPTRFVPQPGQEKPPEPLTFGAGKHVCLGIHLAHVETMVFAAELLRNFEMKPGSPKPPTISSGLTTKPEGGINVSFTPIRREGGSK